MFLWLYGDSGTFFLEQDNTAGNLGATLRGPGLAGQSQPVHPECDTWIERHLDDGASIWELRITAQPDSQSCHFRLTVEDISPFIIPGPGVVTSHFPKPQPVLRLAKNSPFTLWCDVPEGLPRLTLQSHLPAAALPEVAQPNGVTVPLQWSNNNYAYRVGEVEVQGVPGYWALPVQGCADGTRLTTFEGLPLFLAQPPQRFPYATVTVTITSGDKPIAARARAYRHEDLLTLCDLFAGETATFFVPPGSLTLLGSAGISFEACAESMLLDATGHKHINMRLDPSLAPEPNWYAGDHHMHSYIEDDGGQSPEAVVRAARAEGLNYIFLTDEPEPLLAAGLANYSVPGQFLALPGQEVMNEEVHCNALNTKRTLDYTKSPAEWLNDIAQQSLEGAPATLMLNHPSHRPEVAVRRAYFRSWWVADQHPEIRLVENFDLPSWYERLNKRHRLTGLWTSDGHDVVFIPPGTYRTYVHIPNEFTAANVLAALEAGRCFNTRHPGALLYLSANNAGVGETARPEMTNGSSCYSVRVRCDSNRPLKRIDLVCRGEIIRQWFPSGSRRVVIEEDLPLEDWVIALAYAIEEPIPEDDHRGTPLDVAGCIAFTNPVWIESPV